MSRPIGPGEPRPDKFRGGKPGGPKQKTPKPKPETPPKPKREKIPPPEPFKPTEEQIAQVEARYQELAVPTEFDGIRTQPKFTAFVAGLGGPVNPVAIK